MITFAAVIELRTLACGLMIRVPEHSISPLASPSIRRSRSETYLPGVWIDHALVARIGAAELHRVGRHLCPLIGKAIRIQIADNVLADAGVGLGVSLGSEDHSWLLPRHRVAQRAGTRARRSGVRTDSLAVKRKSR
jgi:hypothetical protein